MDVGGSKISNFLRRGICTCGCPLTDQSHYHLKLLHFKTKLVHFKGISMISGFTVEGEVILRQSDSLTFGTNTQPESPNAVVAY